jgi:hypothetical protein
LQEWLAKVKKLRRLKGTLKDTDADVIALEAEVSAGLKQHPEWADAL